jgi:hypothetical protein
LLPRDQFQVRRLERGSQCRPRLGQHRICPFLIDGVLLLQFGDLGFHVGPHRAIGAALVEGHPSNDLCRFIDDKVERKTGRSDALGGVALRDLDQLPQRPAGLADAIDVRVDVRRAFDDMEGNQ